MLIYFGVVLLLIFITFLLTRNFYNRKLLQKDDEIQKLHTVNPDTGIYYRTYFDKIFLSEFHRARRIQHPIALIFIYNPGNTIIDKKLTATIKRDTDFVSYFEDKTYVCVLYNTDVEGVDNVIKRLFNTLSENDELKIGIHTQIPDNHTSSKNLIDEAYKALNRAKNSQGMAVEFSLNSI